MLKHKILGLDVGSKTVGIAISDLMGWTAQGLDTLRINEEQDDLGIDQSQAKEMLKKDEKAFKGVKGVTYKVDYKDQKAVEHIDVDYKEVDVDKLKKNLGFESAKAKKKDYVSMKKLVKQLKRNGLKEKSKMNDE